MRSVAKVFGIIFLLVSSSSCAFQIGTSFNTNGGSSCFESKYIEESESICCDDSYHNSSFGGLSKSQNSFVFSLEELRLTGEWLAMDYCQDGCVYNDYFFIFDSIGQCDVYNLTSYNLVDTFKLPDYLGLVPHSNSACFGSKYCETDSFPLLYVNLYNNYPFDESTFGMCVVYRITYDGHFSCEIVQAIKIGFTSNSELWIGGHHGSSPYGNFLIENDYLWVYLSDYDSLSTRFFKFKLPPINVSNNSTYLTLDKNDIVLYFDTIFFDHIQGGTIYNGVLYSLEGLGSEDSPAVMRAVFLKTQKVLSLSLNNLLGQIEPECIALYDDSFLITEHRGRVFCLKTAQ